LRNIPTPSFQVRKEVAYVPNTYKVKDCGSSLVNWSEAIKGKDYKLTFKEFFIVYSFIYTCIH
jgi:hypothetical protein